MSRSTASGSSLWVCVCVCHEVRDDDVHQFEEVTVYETTKLLYDRKYHSHTQKHITNHSHTQKHITNHPPNKVAKGN
jgi:hypothetical protein